MADELGETPREYMQKNPAEVLRAELIRNKFRYTEIALQYAKDTSATEEEEDIRRQLENEITVTQGPGWELLVKNLENILSMSGAFVPVKKELIAKRYPELKKLYLMAYELSANDDSESLTDIITARVIELLQDKNILKEKFGTAESMIYTAFESVYATGRDMRKPLLNSIEEQDFLQEQMASHHKNEPRGHAPSPMLAEVANDELPEPPTKYDEAAIAPDIRAYIESKPMKQALAQLPDPEPEYVAPTVDETKISAAIPQFVNGGEMSDLLKKLADESKDSK